LNCVRDDSLLLFQVTDMFSSAPNLRFVPILAAFAAILFASSASAVDEKPKPPAALTPALSQRARESTADEKPATLTSVAAVRRLTTAEAAQGLPVKFLGVITFHAQINRMLFVQDETGGIYVHTKYLQPPQSELPAGTLVEIEGITVPGKFAPFVVGRDNGPVVIRALGQAPLPEPLRLTEDQMSDPQNHSQWIEVGGVVRAFHRGTVTDDEGIDSEQAVLAIGSGGQRFNAVIFGEESRDASFGDLIGAQVRLRGVFGSEFNDRRQLLGMRLFVTSRQEIIVDRPGGGSPFNLPVRPINTLMQFSAGTDNGTRAHVRGRVTLVSGRRGFYMQDDTAGLWVSSDNLPELQSGDAVDVAGFSAKGSWNPVLEDAEIRRESQATPSGAKPVSLSDAFAGGLCFRYVQVEGKLLESSRHELQPTLVLEADGRVFIAQMANAAIGLPHAEPGSWLRLSGICLNEEAPKTEPDSSAIYSNQPTRTATFQLLLGSPGDIVVMHEPPWWTVQRLVAMVGVLLAILCAAALWVMLLRRKISEQTGIIRERFAREAVYEERTRIARELHDTLEQEMTGIAMHIDVAGAILGKSPDEARRSLETARKLLDRSCVESRRSIWELRSTTLEQGGLVAAFEEQARAIHKATEPRVELTVEGEPRRLPAKVETHLYRIGNEALTNSLKHSGARLISILLRFEPEEVSVCVEDDGGGFDVPTNGTAQTGRFGLLGMKERAAKIHASFQLDSRAGHGTCIRTSVRTQFAETEKRGQNDLIKSF
jgi:signal transduction histidine kinase